MKPRASDYKINETTFRVTYGDITKLVADALVSSDDNYLSMGGGVSMALVRAGGENIRAEARKHAPLRLGDVAVTSAGKLSAKFIFHAVTIDYDKMLYPSEESVHAATLKCMELADTLKVRLIAFPALGTGVGGFPFQLAAETMTRTIADYLMGQTQVELVTLALFARENVRDDELNVFYERCVALASLSTQSKRLGTLLTELRQIIGGMNMPQLTKQVLEIEEKVREAQVTLSESPSDLLRLEQLQEQSKMTTLSEKVVAVSNETQEALTWGDKKLEEDVLRTKLNGLLTQLNIQTSHLNKYEIERAKYGGIGIPPRLETAIEDIGREISETEARVASARKELVAVVAS